MDVSKLVSSVEQPVKQVSNFIKSMPFVQVLALLVVIVTMSDYTNDLPIQVRMVLKNDLFRFVVLLLTFYVFTDNLLVSVIVAAMVTFFSMGLKMLGVIDRFDLVSPEPNIAIGCVGIKASDIVNYFNGDVESLKKYLHDLGVPSNIEINDTNAPLLATYLIGVGHKLSASCQQPYLKNESEDGNSKIIVV
ncbi:MAG TPA: hypothetical protein V6C58_14045 [Allocoleopsis sp.]